MCKLLNNLKRWLSRFPCSGQSLCGVVSEVLTTCARFSVPSALKNLGLLVPAAVANIPNDERMDVVQWKATMYAPPPLLLMLLSSFSPPFQSVGRLYLRRG